MSAQRSAISASRRRVTRSSTWPRLDEQRGRLHQVAEDAELALRAGAVAAQHRAAVAIARQVERLLLRATGRRPGGTSCAARAVAPHRRGQPGERGLRLLRRADAQERLDGVGHVAHPGVAVVVVLVAAEPLGQRGGGGGGDGAGRREQQQLQGQRAAAHRVGVGPVDRRGCRSTRATPGRTGRSGRRCRASGGRISGSSAEASSASVAREPGAVASRAASRRSSRRVRSTASSARKAAITPVDVQHVAVRAGLAPRRWPVPAGGRRAPRCANSTRPSRPSTRRASSLHGRRPEMPLFSEAVTRARPWPVVNTCSSTLLPAR